MKFIIDKNYIFRPIVVIIRFYPKLYARKESVHTMCARALIISVKSNDGHYWPKHVVFIYNRHHLLDKH